MASQLSLEVHSRDSVPSSLLGFGATTFG
jgi:hypothetical protein